jgi:PAS domain S-box-containing protein
MRISLSKKVFFVFASLTSLTLILGVILYSGIKNLHALHDKFEVINSFQLQIKDLDSFRLGLGRAHVQHNQDHFKEEFVKAKEIVAIMNTFDLRMKAELQQKLENLTTYLDNYGKAYLELFEKYELDNDFAFDRPILTKALSEKVRTLPMKQQLTLQETLKSIHYEKDQLYLQRDSIKIRNLKKLRDQLSRITRDSEILREVDSFIHIAESNYFNYLGILDSEEFLKGSSDHFYAFAKDTIAAFALDHQRSQDRLLYAINAIVLLALFFTVCWWFLISRYFRKFLVNQQCGIEAISVSRYDYDVPNTISDDEIGDLTLFMKELAKKLKESRDLYQTLVENINLGITLVSRDYTVLAANAFTGKLTGKSSADLIGKKCYWEFERREDVCIHCPGKKTMESGRPEERTTKVVFDDGRILHVRIQAFSTHDDAGNIDGFIEVVEDVTEKKKAEEEKRDLEKQIQHVQKLESLGVLAGGIAHDFNNLLMAILGNADLALLDLSPTAPARENIVEIEKASHRAADLCKQMLAYSGKGKFTVKAINLSELVKDMAHMLEISVSKRSVLRYNFGDNLPPIKADPSQLRQIIMNLVINASEAIGDRSGVISITTGAMECDRDYLADTYLDEQLPEGVYTYLEVADNGCGMDEEVRAKLFDPFFTTKFTGRGLGMSAVLGIVRGHGGGIKVYSEVKKGTTFKIIFPAVAGEQTEILEKEEHDDKEFHAQGTILLVDDDETVRTVGKQMIEHLGFKVLTAADGLEGLERFKKQHEDIDCVILDLTMPHMDGEEAFREMRRVQPDVRVILSSGYNEQEVTQRFVGKGLAGFIQKPYNMTGLKKVIKAVFPEEGKAD